MLPDQCQIALKEWAVTVESLAEGQQILLLRKGGIHEEGKDFKVIHPEFLLYPTYEHQRKDLLKPQHQPGVHTAGRIGRLPVRRLHTLRNHLGAALRSACRSERRPDSRSDRMNK